MSFTQFRNNNAWSDGHQVGSNVDDADATSCSAAAVIDDKSVVVVDAVAASASIISGAMGRDPNPGRVNEKASPLLPSEDEDGALLLIHLMCVGRLVLATLTLLVVGERELPTSTR